MQTYEAKLIVLRGNSGSGKSTAAIKLREVSDRQIAIVEQDYLRRFILKEKETQGTNNIGLIEQTVVYALSRGYDVILEGILYFPRYGAMLKKLATVAPNNYFFYFDVSLEETLKRHSTKPNAHEFGEKEMREWYNLRDFTHFEGETVIPEELSLEEAVHMIQQQAGL